MSVRARMRAGSAWCDLHVLDLSTRGIGAQAANPPSVGSYLEVRRGPNIIVARVVWARQQRFGARCQDDLAIDSFLAEQAAAESPLLIERRAAPRPNCQQFESSRQSARMMEFVGLVAAGAGAAAIGFAAVHEALAKPLAAVMSAIG